MKEVVKMAGLSEWIRNIICYLIFVTVTVNLLPNKKYETYIRFFAGIVLILLVLKPVTGGLRLDDTLAYYFESISLKKEAGELAGEFSKMEEARLERMISQYEKAVGEDLALMAQTEGFLSREARVSINRVQESPAFGRVVSVSLVLAPEQGSFVGFLESGGSTEREKEVEKNQIDEVKVTVSQPKLPPDPVQTSASGNEMEENSRISGLRKRIAQYYDLEERDIEIQVENGKG